MLKEIVQYFLKEKCGRSVTENHFIAFKGPDETFMRSDGNAALVTSYNFL